jgi:hypothetical protein
MKINLEKLREIEKDFEGDHITSGVLQTMLNTVLEFYNTPNNSTPNNVRLAVNTLADLGIIEEEKEPSKKIKQINS